MLPCQDRHWYLSKPNVPEHVCLLNRSVRHGLFDRFAPGGCAHGQNVLVHACYNGKRCYQLTAYYDHVARQQTNVLTPGPIGYRLNMVEDLNVICFRRNVPPEGFKLWGKRRCRGASSAHAGSRSRAGSGRV